MFVTVSGPSGAGKSTLIRSLGTAGGATPLPSYTTRPPREGEARDSYYRFVSSAVFRGMAEAGEFVLIDHVGAHQYGTAASDLSAALAGLHVYIADFTAASAYEAHVKGMPPQLAIILYVDLAESMNRMRMRGDTEEVVVERARRWAPELAECVKYAATGANALILDASRTVDMLTQDALSAIAACR